MSCLQVQKFIYVLYCRRWRSAPSPHQFHVTSNSSIREESKQEFVAYLIGTLARRTGLSLKYHEVDLPFPTSLVETTFLAGRELRCCYKATVDGFSATDFHDCCDFKGPCIVNGYTDGSLKFGAFNPEGYRSTDYYYDTFDAFLFYWKDADNGELVTLPKVGGSGAALFVYARGGPQFGADGLLIGPPLAPVMGGFVGPDTNSGVGDLRQVKSRLDCLMLIGKMGNSSSLEMRPGPHRRRF